MCDSWCILSLLLFAIVLVYSFFNKYFPVDIHSAFIQLGANYNLLCSCTHSSAFRYTSQCNFCSVRKQWVYENLSLLKSIFSYYTSINIFIHTCYDIFMPRLCLTIILFTCSSGYIKVFLCYLIGISVVAGNAEKIVFNVWFWPFYDLYYLYCVNVCRHKCESQREIGAICLSPFPHETWELNSGHQSW